MLSTEWGENNPTWFFSPLKNKFGNPNKDGLAGGGQAASVWPDYRDRRSPHRQSCHV